MRETVTTSGQIASSASATAAPDEGVVVPIQGVPAGGRYQFVEQIARGGMGVVYRAIDRVLEREIAVKVLDSAYSPDSAAGRRFLVEARITGQLQHPSVPAVHDLGTLPDGRPFLAMKLIQGRTLEGHLRDFDASALNLVAIFEQIAQAVGYAHSKGVIHRDLKPANVMVGAFGEVQVMDWGLAKVLASGREEARSEADPGATTARPPITDRGEEPSYTEYGSFMGTAAFVPPEQAGGEIDKVDERADVFGLGGILCVALTGQPPYVGKDFATVRLMATRGQLGDALARLDGCGAEPGLVALCKRCLAFDPADRPRNGEEVAREVAGLRAAAEQRARTAELERAKAQTEAREQTRRRKVQLALAASLMLTLLAVGGGWFWVNHQAAAREASLLADRATKQSQTESALADAYKARAASDWPEALAQVKRAETILEGLPPNEEQSNRVQELRQAIADEQADRRFLADLNDAGNASTAGPGLHDKNGPAGFGHDRTVVAYRKVFSDFGLVAGEVPPAKAAARIAGRPKAVRDEIVSTLIDWQAAAHHPLVKDPHRAWVDEVSKALGTDNEIDRLKAITQMPDPVKRLSLLRAFAEAIDTTKTPARILPRLAGGVRDSGAGDIACQLLLRAQSQYPGDFWIDLALTQGYEAYLTPDQIIRFGYAALASRPESGTCRHNLFFICCGQMRWKDAAHVNLWFLGKDKNDLARTGYHAYVLERAGRLEEAEVYHRRLLAIRGDDPQSYAGLGLLLRRMGRPDEAEEYFQKSKARDPQYATASLVAGYDLLEKGRYVEALAAFDQNPNRSHPLVEMAKLRVGGLLAVQKMVAATVAGRYRPPFQSLRLTLEETCRVRRFNRTAVMLTNEAFVGDARLAPDLAAGYRYRAACCAALIASGQDAGTPPTAAERRQYATIADQWLRADLAGWTFEARDRANWPAVRRNLAGWKQDEALMPLRDPAKLAAMPAEDGKKWKSFWAEVDALLVRVSPREVSTPPRKP